MINFSSDQDNFNTLDEEMRDNESSAISFRDFSADLNDPTIFRRARGEEKSPEPLESPEYVDNRMSEDSSEGFKSNESWKTLFDKPVKEKTPEDIRRERLQDRLKTYYMYNEGINRQSEFMPRKPFGDFPNVYYEEHIKKRELREKEIEEDIKKRINDILIFKLFNKSKDLEELPPDQILYLENDIYDVQDDDLYDIEEIYNRKIKKITELAKEQSEKFIKQYKKHKLKRLMEKKRLKRMNKYDNTRIIKDDSELDNLDELEEFELLDSEEDIIGNFNTGIATNAIEEDIDISENIYINDKYDLNFDNLVEGRPNLYELSSKHIISYLNREEQKKDLMTAINENVELKINQPPRSDANKNFMILKQIEKFKKQHTENIKKKKLDSKMREDSDNNLFYDKRMYLTNYKKYDNDDYDYDNLMIIFNIFENNLLKLNLSFNNSEDYKNILLEFDKKYYNKVKNINIDDKIFQKIKNYPDDILKKINEGYILYKYIYNDITGAIDYYETNINTVNDMDKFSKILKNKYFSLLKVNLNDVLPIIGWNLREKMPIYIYNLFFNKETYGNLAPSKKKKRKRVDDFIIPAQSVLNTEDLKQLQEFSNIVNNAKEEEINNQRDISDILKIGNTHIKLSKNIQKKLDKYDYFKKYNIGVQDEDMDIILNPSDLIYNSIINLDEKNDYIIKIKKIYDTLPDLKIQFDNLVLKLIKEKENLNKIKKKIKKTTDEKKLKNLNTLLENTASKYENYKDEIENIKHKMYEIGIMEGEDLDNIDTIILNNIRGNKLENEINSIIQDQIITDKKKILKQFNIAYKQQAGEKKIKIDDDINPVIYDLIEMTDKNKIANNELMLYRKNEKSIRDLDNMINDGETVVYNNFLKNLKEKEIKTRDELLLDINKEKINYITETYSSIDEYNALRKELETYEKLLKESNEILKNDDDKNKLKAGRDKQYAEDKIKEIKYELELYDFSKILNESNQDNKKYNITLKDKILDILVNKEIMNKIKNNNDMDELVSMFNNVDIQVEKDDINEIVNIINNITINIQETFSNDPNNINIYDKIASDRKISNISYSRLYNKKTQDIYMERVRLLLLNVIKMPKLFLLLKESIITFINSKSLWRRHESELLYDWIVNVSLDEKYIITDEKNEHFRDIILDDKIIINVIYIFFKMNNLLSLDDLNIIKNYELANKINTAQLKNILNEYLKNMIIFYDSLSINMNNISENKLKTFLLNICKILSEEELDRFYFLFKQYLQKNSDKIDNIFFKFLSNTNKHQDLANAFYYLMTGTGTYYDIVNKKYDTKLEKKYVLIIFSGKELYNYIFFDKIIKEYSPNNVILYINNYDKNNQVHNNFIKVSKLFKINMIILPTHTETIWEMDDYYDIAKDKILIYHGITLDKNNFSVFYDYDIFNEVMVDKKFNKFEENKFIIDTNDSDDVAIDLNIDITSKNFNYYYENNKIIGFVYDNTLDKNLYSYTKNMVFKDETIKNHYKTEQKIFQISYKNKPVKEFIIFHYFYKQKNTYFIYYVLEKLISLYPPENIIVYVHNSNELTSDIKDIFNSFNIYKFDINNIVQQDDDYDLSLIKKIYNDDNIRGVIKHEDIYTIFMPDFYDNDLKTRNNLIIENKLFGLYQRPNMNNFELQKYYRLREFKNRLLLAPIQKSNLEKQIMLKEYEKKLINQLNYEIIIHYMDNMKKTNSLDVLIFIKIMAEITRKTLKICKNIYKNKKTGEKYLFILQNKFKFITKLFFTGDIQNLLKYYNTNIGNFNNDYNKVSSKLIKYFKLNENYCFDFEFINYFVSAYEHQNFSYEENFKLLENKQINKNEIFNIMNKFIKSEYDILKKFTISVINENNDNVKNLSKSDIISDEKILALSDKELNERKKTLGYELMLTFFKKVNIMNIFTNNINKTITYLDTIDKFFIMKPEIRQKIPEYLNLRHTISAQTITLANEDYLKNIYDKMLKNANKYEEILNIFKDKETFKEALMDKKYIIELLSRDNYKLETILMDTLREWKQMQMINISRIKKLIEHKFYLENIEEGMQEISTEKIFIKPEYDEYEDMKVRFLNRKEEEEEVTPEILPEIEKMPNVPKGLLKQYGFVSDDDDDFSFMDEDE